MTNGKTKHAGCFRSDPTVDVYQAAAVAASGIVGFQSALKGGELMKIPDFGSIA